MNFELKLRAVEPEDADMMYEAESDEAAWTYSDYLAPLSRELLCQYALTYDADPLRSGQIRLIIEKDNVPIGLLDIFDISSRHLRADTGIYILPQYRGNGFATKALDAAKEFCRIRLGLHQLTASVSKVNTKARVCFERAGFIMTGIRPDWLRTPDGFEDVELFVCILNTNNR